MPLAQDCLLSELCLHAVGTLEFPAGCSWSFSVTALPAMTWWRTCQSLTNISSYFSLHCCHPPIIPPAWLISWDLTPDLNGVAWQASDVVCPKAGILGFSSSLRPGRWELLAQSCPVLHPLPNPPWDQLPGAYQGGEDSPLGTACPTHIVKT